MANSFKNSIQLGIKLQKSSDVQKELNSLIKELSKSKIDLKIDLKDKNILGTLEKLSKELKDINTTNFSNVDKNLKNVAKAIGDTENKAKALNSTLGGGFSSSNVSATTKAYDTLSQKVEDVNRKVNEVNKSTKESIAQVGNNIQKTGDSISSVGSTLTNKVTTPLLVLGGVAGKIGMDFDSQMSRVKAISGATGEEFNKLKDQALQLGADTAFSAKQSAEGMENLASAGFNTNEIMEAMPGLLDLAASSGESLANSSDIAASTLRGFGLEASESARVADVLAKNASSTNAAVADTGEAMKYIAPVAHSMGLSLEEVTAAIGEMANAGIKGTQAGTTLRSALTRLASPSKESAGAMDSIGFSAFDAEGKLNSLSTIINDYSKALEGKTDQEKQDLTATIFGQEAMSGMLTLIDNGSSALDTLTESYKNATGSAEEMAKTMQDNSKASVEQMIGSLETMAIKLEEAVAPSIINVSNEIQDLANKFSELPQPVQESIVKTALLVATIGPVTKVVGGLTSGIGSLITLGGRLGTTLGIIGQGARIGGTALTAFSTAGMVVTGVAGALVLGIAGAVTYQNLLNKSVATSTDELSTWEKVVNTATGSVVKSKAELQKAGLIYEDFAEGVSDSFKEGIEKATETFHDFEMTITGENSGEKISEEGKKKISSAIDTMIDSAKSTINKRKSEIQSELSKMFNQKGGIDSGEQAVLDEASKASDAKLKQVEEIQGKISDVWTKAIQEHGKLSQQDVETIENYLQQVQQIKAEVEAKNTAESDFAKNQFGERLKGISAEDATKEYAEASQTLSKNFADARATYSTGMQELAKMQKEAEDAGETARAESFKKQIEDKKKEYDELINTEKTKRREYLDMLYEKNPQLNGKLNEVDGTMFSTKDFNAQKDLNKLKQQFSEIANVTESGMIRVKDANGKWNDILVQVDSATGNITSAYNTMTGEFGAYSEKFANDAESSGDRVKDSLENLEKSLTTLGGGIKLDNANNAINASTDELIGKLQTVIEKADGTKIAIQDINGTQVKLEFDKDGTLTNLTDVQDAINGDITNNPAVVDVDVNDADALAKFTETENNINNINGQTPTITPQAETNEADSKLDTTSQKVDELDSKSATPTVTIDAGDSLSIIDRIKNFFAWISGKTASATVNVDKTGSVTEGDGYATGTDNATQGFHDTAEEGFEIMVGRKKRWFNGGEKVLNHNDSVEVLNDLMNGKGSQSDEQAQVIPVETETQQIIEIKPKKTDIYQGKLDNSETLSVDTSNTLDKPYVSETDTSNMSDAEKKAYEEKKKAQEDEEKRLKDLATKEKQYLEDISSAWESNSTATQQSLKELELKEDEYGKNITVSEKADLLEQKYQRQLDLLPEAEKQLNTYKNTTVTTQEAQEELAKKIQDANDTLIEQKKAIVDAYNAMKDYEEDQIRSYLETQQKTQEIELEVKEKKEINDLTESIYGISEDDYNDYIQNQKDAIEEEISNLKDRVDLDEDDVSARDALVAKQEELNALESESYSNLKDFQSAFEDIHNQRISAIEDELEALEKEHDSQEAENELLEKKKSLTEAQQALEKAKNDKSVYQYVKNSDGTWDFQWMADQTKVDSAQKAVDDAQSSYDDTVAKQEYEAQKAKLEQQLADEQIILNTKQKMYDKQLKALKAEQQSEKDQFEYHYSDMDKLVEQEMEDLNQKYGDNWKLIYETIDQNLTDVENRYDTLSKLKVSLGIDGMADSIDTSSTSDVNGVISSSSSKSNDILNVDENKLKVELQQYTNALQQKLDTMTNYAKKMVDIKANLESNMISLQNQSQETQLTSLQSFAIKYTTFTDKFLEMLQLIYDFRYTNIVNLTTGMQDLIKSALLSCEEAYQDFVEMSEAMGIEVDGSIDISSALSKMNEYKASVAEWTSTKQYMYNTTLSDYALSSDSLKDYYSNISSFISSDALSKIGSISLPSSYLNSLSSGTVVNNKSTSSDTYYQIGTIEMTANTDDPAETFNNIVSYVNQKASLQK